MPDKHIIGRSDKADFPEFELSNLELKIDTGAYTSSMHCTHVHEITKNGQNYLSFKLLDPEHPSYNNKEFCTTHYTKKVVKSSNGLAEERFVISTSITLFGNAYEIDLTLTGRGEMKYPILLGRKFLTSRFIVDTAKKNLSFKQKHKT
jgi:hypothetical protein